MLEELNPYFSMASADSPFNFLRRSAKIIKHKSDKSFILLSCTKAQKGVRRVIPYYCALHLETVKTRLFPSFFSSIFGYRIQEPPYAASCMTTPCEHPWVGA